MTKYFHGQDQFLVDVKKISKKMVRIHSWLLVQTLMLKACFQYSDLKCSYIDRNSMSIVTDEIWEAALESSTNKHVDAKVVAVVGQKPWRLPEA